MYLLKFDALNFFLMFCIFLTIFIITPFTRDRILISVLLISYIVCYYILYYLCIKKLVFYTYDKFFFYILVFRNILTLVISFYWYYYYVHNYKLLIRTKNHIKKKKIKNVMILYTTLFIFLWIRIVIENKNYIMLRIKH